MSEPLDLEPIKARLVAADSARPRHWPRAPWDEDRAALIAEVERLRAETRRMALRELTRLSEDQPGGYQ